MQESDFANIQKYGRRFVRRIFECQVDQLWAYSLGFA